MVYSVRSGLIGACRAVIHARGVAGLSRRNLAEIPPSRPGHDLVIGIPGGISGPGLAARRYSGKQEDTPSGVVLKDHVRFLDSSYHDALNNRSGLKPDDPRHLSITHSDETKRLNSKMLDELSRVKELYCVFEINGKKYVAGKGDVVRADWMKELDLGDKILLNRVKEIGGKDFAIKGNPYIYKKYFSLEGTVIEHVISKETTKIVRTKKRRRFKFEYQHFTSIRINELRIVAPT